MPLKDITADAVNKAIAECTMLGNAPFLAKYGFRQSRAYVVFLDGRRFDSKAIIGAAHGYLTNQVPLTNKEFSGGDKTVAKILRDLGFDVQVGPQQPRNPPWVRDELILALDLYMSNPTSPPDKRSNEVRDLSELLKRLGSLLDLPMGPDHRNPNGVYMKVMNFRQFDPEFAAVGKVGLSHGGAGDKLVWDEFAHRPDLLGVVASEIRANASNGELRRFLPDHYNQEAAEGRLVSAQHFRRERNAQIIADRKRKSMDETGELRCQGCGMAFHDRYGDHGRDFIEVHHIVPLHTYLKDGGTTKLDDLALVCANCHRMIHRKGSWLTMEQLRAIVLEAPVAFSN